MVILRFIPAYAGNSMELMTLTKVCSVHPRLRGELAYAGNSETRAGLGRVGAVHPRLRGELNRSSR